jgi:hypothetical protein
LRSAPVLTDIDAKPDRNSVLGGHESNAKFRPPQKAFDRPVVSRDVPPRRMPFETQEKTFGTLRSVTPDVRTRTFNDGAGKVQTHVTVTAPREGAGMPTATRTNVDGRRNVPRPAEQTNVNVDFGPRREENNVRADAPVNKQKWAVPRPPEGRQTTVDNTVREVRNPPQSSNPVRDWQRSGHQESPRVTPNVAPNAEMRQHVNVGDGRNTTTREVYRPPQEQQAQRRPDPPQRTTVVPQRAPETPRSPQPVQQRTERAPETRQNNSSAAQSNQGGDRGGTHTQQGNSSNRGGRRSD